MTDAHAQRSATPWANYGNKPHRMGATTPADDDIIAYVAEDIGVYYHATMGELEGNEFLWWDKARKFAWRWLDNQGCKSNTNRKDIVSKAEKNNLVRSANGFRAFMDSVDEGWFEMQQETIKHRWKQAAREMLADHFKLKMAESDVITRSAMGSAESEAEYIAACITGAEGRIHGTQAHLSASDEDLYDFLCTAVHMCIDAGVSYASIPRTINLSLKLSSILNYKGTWPEAKGKLTAHLAGIAKQREETTVMPKPDTAMAQLNETLATAEKEQDKPAKSKAEWTDDQNQLGSYFLTLGNLCSARNLTDDQRDEVRREAQGCEHIHDTEYDKNTLTKRTKDIIDRLYPANVPETKAAAKPAATKEPSKAGANDSVGSVEPPIANAAPVGEISPVNPPVAETAQPTNILPMVRTLTGISVLNIATELNKHLPPEAYGAIKYGQMSGKTDIDGDYVRDRFDQVFGPMGIGWRINPHKTAGRVEYRSEIRLNKDKVEQTWHIVTLLAHTLQYCMVMPDGSLIWVEASTTTDQHDNMDEQYAYRGALTSLTKQFYRLMGGMNHILHNEYTHVHAQAEIAKRNRKAS